MKKLFSLLLIILPALTFAQADSTAKMVLKAEQYSTSVLNGQTILNLEEPIAKSLQGAVTVLTETAKAQKITIDSLKALTFNQGLQISNLQQQVTGAEIIVDTTVRAFTIAAQHNGAVIKFRGRCTVTFPSGLNIKCSIMRIGTGAVTISGSFQSQLGYRNVAGTPGKIDVDYTNGIALITGNLTK